jgi:CheY-like chemotaxis protein
MRILIVDDDQDSAEAVAVTLEDKGHTSTIAKDGEAAILVLKAYKFDVILLDINLGFGRMSGLDVLRHRIEDPSLAKIPVVIISGMEAAQIHAKANVQANPLEGTVLILGKPFSADMLFRALQAVDTKKEAS